MSEWRQVLGASKYEVSDVGQVRRLGGKIRSTYLNNTYPAVTMRLDDGRYTLQFIHRMVCGAFHGPPPTSRHVVRHLNGHPEDNRPENLAWGTMSENQFDRVRHGRSPQANLTHCKHGHEFTPENTRSANVKGSDKSTRRSCRTCETVRQREYRQRKRKTS